MAETKRLFVAVPVTDKVKQVWRNNQHHYHNEAIRFVPEDNLHLTIHFLGEVPISKVENIEQTLLAVTANFSTFSLSLEALEPGPKVKSPRLIWARFAAHAGFSKLCAGVASQLAIRPPDHPDYIPHITVARFRKDVPKPVSLPVIPFNEENFKLPVSSLALWQSELKSPHPVYSIVKEFPLLNTLS